MALVYLLMEERAILRARIKEHDPPKIGNYRHRKTCSCKDCERFRERKATVPGTYRSLYSLHRRAEFIREGRLAMLNAAIERLLPKPLRRVA
jgi:hypothetical protein